MQVTQHAQVTIKDRNQGWTERNRRTFYVFYPFSSSWITYGPCSLFSLLDVVFYLLVRFGRSNITTPVYIHQSVIHLFWSVSFLLLLPFCPVPQNWIEKSNVQSRINKRYLLPLTYWFSHSIPVTGILMVHQVYTPKGILLCGWYHRL